jgi:hypothetical protein
MRLPPSPPALTAPVAVSAALPSLLPLTLAASFAAVETNPLFHGDLSDAVSSTSSSAESYTGAAPTVTTPSTAVLQTVNIRSHVPVMLELAEPNYAEWRTFFDAFISKFGLATQPVKPVNWASTFSCPFLLQLQCPMFLFSLYTLTSGHHP